MGKRRTMIFIGKCQIVKTFRKGKDIHIVMRCPKKNVSAEDIVRSLR